MLDQLKQEKDQKKRIMESQVIVCRDCDAQMCRVNVVLFPNHRCGLGAQIFVSSRNCGAQMWRVNIDNGEILLPYSTHNSMRKGENVL